MTEIIFLGTGTSTGVPELGCNCNVCTSTDAKDQRLRTSVLIKHNEQTFLIDCGPDFRQQMLLSGNNELDAVFITHEHYDHVGGLDDLRPYCRKMSLPVFAEKYVIERLKQRIPYCFTENPYPGVPKLQLQEIDLNTIEIEDSLIVPIRVMHGDLPIVGFRIGNMAFLTDLTEIPDEEYAKLKNLDVLVIAALRKQKHNTHQNIDEAISKINTIKPFRSYLIHASHHIGLHSDVSQELPDNIYLSYDGLRVVIT